MTIISTRKYLLSKYNLPTRRSRPPFSRGISLYSEQVSLPFSYQWPTHAAIPWRESSFQGRYFRLGVFEDGIEIPSQEMDVQTWDMQGVDLRWSHIHFIWEKGRHYTVRGVSPYTSVPLPVHAIRITDTSSTIVVETGKLKAVIDKESFSLFSELYFDAAGRGTSFQRILNGSVGPEILDNGASYATRFDQDVKVRVEIQGPLYVVIRAEGVYRESGATGRDWANFTTRIHFWADQD